jgi:hypothetical protein
VSLGTAFHVATLVAIILVCSFYLWREHRRAVSRRITTGDKIRVRLRTGQTMLAVVRSVREYGDGGRLLVIDRLTELESGKLIFKPEGIVISCYRARPL